MPDVRPIDANALKESVRKVPVFRTYDAGPPDLRSLVDSAPTLDYAPVRHGEWEYRMGSYSMPNCSCCGWRIPYSEDSELDARNFCPNCGAMMDGGKENV